MLWTTSGVCPRGSCFSNSVLIQARSVRRNCAGGSIAGASSSISQGSTTSAASTMNNALQPTRRFILFGLVAHEVGGLEECRDQFLLHGGVHPHVLHRADHAAHPLVALGCADGKRHVAAAQEGVTETVGVFRRAAGPAGEEPEQLVARFGEISRVQFADAVVIRILVHQIVEAVDQLADDVAAAEAFVMGLHVQAFTGLIAAAAALARLLAVLVVSAEASATPMRRRAKASGLPNRRISTPGVRIASATPSKAMPVASMLP